MPTDLAAELAELAKLALSQIPAGPNPPREAFPPFFKTIASLAQGGLSASELRPELVRIVPKAQLGDLHSALRQAERNSNRFKHSDAQRLRRSLETISNILRAASAGRLTNPAATSQVQSAPSAAPVEERRIRLRRVLEPKLQELVLSGLAVGALELAIENIIPALNELFGYEHLKKYTEGKTDLDPGGPDWFVVKRIGSEIFSILAADPGPMPSPDSPVPEMVEDDEEPDDGEDTSSPDITHPFDPNKIRVRTWSPTVYNLMQRLTHRELDLAPEFQRKAGVWGPKRQSRLIESLLIRIPLPAFYLDEMPARSGDVEVAERYAVVDGVQRLTVLSQFINEKSLRLSGLEFLTKLNGKSFDDLDPPLQRRILETQLSVNVVEPGTPDEAKLNIFKRINTGGVALTSQEIRHAMNPGPVRTWLGTLTQSPEFLNAVGPRTAQKMSERMQDRECAIRFAAFLGRGVDDYRATDTDFDGFLHRAMKRVNRLSDADRQAIEQRFLRAMRAASSTFGKFAFRKVMPANRRGPVNKALFEATAVNLDARSDSEISKLEGRATQLLERYREAFSDLEFDAAVSVGTGDRAKVERRFSALRKVIEGSIA